MLGFYKFILNKLKQLKQSLNSFGQTNYMGVARMVDIVQYSQLPISSYAALILGLSWAYITA
jgi:hypothetical protein